MMRRLGLALAALAALTIGAAGQTRPPAQKTGPITIYGTGSTGDVSKTSVTAGGATKTLDSWLTSVASTLKPTFTGPVKVLPGGQDLGFILNQNFSGTASGALSGSYLSLDDTAKTAAPNVTTFWNMAHNINAGVQGHRNSFQLVTTFNGADNGVTENPYYVTWGPAMVVTAGDNGTAPGGNLTYASGRGAYFIGNPVIKATNAPNLQELSGYEINISADTNSSVAYKSMLALVPLASDAKQGTVKDDMITMSSQPGAVGFRNLINISPSHGAMPVNSGTTILRAGYATVATGIEFGALTFLGDAWNSPGMKITGSGDIKFSPNRAATWDVGAGFTPGTHGAQIQGSNGTLYIDNWDAGLNIRTDTTFDKVVIESLSSPPATSTSNCKTGQHAWDQFYDYRCILPNKWKRTALTDW